ncbi:MAG: SDR family oxidoreductase [Pseudomonadota bacterium]
MLAGATYPDLSGAGVFITGGATGIGAAMVRAFHEQNARVAFNDIDTAAGDSLAAALGNDCTFLPADASDPSALQASVRDAEALTGGLTVLINNVADDRRETPEDISPDGWRQNLAINLDPVIFASQAALPAMVSRKAGRIVNFSSLNAYLGPADLPTYTAAKAAILGLTKSLARHYGPSGIAVNAIVPGWVVTDKQRQLWLTPEAEAQWKDQCALKADLLPEHVASLALFLASDASRMITGQAYTIDAGRT